MSEEHDEWLVVGSEPPGSPGSKEYTCEKCSVPVAVVNTDYQERIDNGKAGAICITCFRIEQGLDDDPAIVSQETYDKAVQILGKQAIDETMEKYNITIGDV